MSTIPTPGSELRHVRKTITFTGGANNGQLDSPITLFTLTGRVMVERGTMFSPTALVGTALGFVTLYILTPGFATPIYDVTADQFTTDNMWSPGVINTTKVEAGVTWVTHHNNVQEPLLLSANLVLVPSDDGGGADVTGGSVIIDVWYRPITDDGALAGDDIDQDSRTWFWAQALADIASVPAITASAKDALNWLFALARNKITQTSSTQTLKKDDGTTTVGTASVSDDGTTFTRNEWS